jgi:hypothetical protein
MRLTEILLNEVLLKEFWGELEETLQIDETITGKLATLLKAADTQLFEPFGITKDDTDKYVVVGSARFYLYPVLREAFKLTEPGDLDIVIPGEEQWQHLKGYLEEKGTWEKHKANWEKRVYRPTNEIEAFNAWKPQTVPGAKDFNVSSTEEIMKDSSVVDGYNFMSFRDIVDYKLKLNRKKEEEVTKLILKYRNSKNPKDKDEIVKGILKLVGEEEERSKEEQEKAVASIFGI